MVEKARPHKQNSFRQTTEFANLARTVGEVDDFVMQEFLTDIIDSGVGPAVLSTGDGLAPVGLPAVSACRAAKGCGCSDRPGAGAGESKIADRADR